MSLYHGSSSLLKGFLVLITGQMRALQVAYSCIEALLKLSLSDDVMLLRSRQSKMNT